MNKTFARKMIAGATGLALSLPMTIGVAFAEETMSSDFMPTTACIDARVTADDVLIAAKSTLNAAEVAAIQSHRAALVAAKALTDTTAQKDAFKKAESDMRMAMKKAMEAHRMSLKTSMDAVKAACKKTDDSMMGKDSGKRGLMNRMMRAFGRGKMKGQGMMSSSSSSNAQ